MYFNNFPNIQYPFYDKNRKLIKKLSKNITLRAKISEYVKTYKTNFDEYLIRDGERSDTLAYRLYERSDLHWIFYIINDFINPYESWPMNSGDLSSHINEKYKGSSFFTPDVWKNLEEYDVFTGTLDSIDSTSEFYPSFINKKTISSLKRNKKVKVSFSGLFFESTIIDVNEKIYEITLETKPWNLNFYQESNRYLYYEIEISGPPQCVRIPITRIINHRRYSVNYFYYNSEYRDPSMDFSLGKNPYEDNPYNFFIFPFNSESIGNGNFANETKQSFADAFAIKGKDGNYMDSSFYITNEEYEMNFNENKRKILIPKPKVVEEVIKQMENIFTG